MTKVEKRVELTRNEWAAVYAAVQVVLTEAEECAPEERPAMMNEMLPLLRRAYAKLKAVQEEPEPCKQ